MLAAMLAGPATARDETQGTALTFTTVISGLKQPVFVTSAPGNPDRLYVVQKTGIIKIFSENTGALLGTLLDIRGSVSTGSEQGLLGLAFDPAFATSAKIYINYTNLSGDTRVREYVLSSATANNPTVVSKRTLLSIDQPYSNHNGGHLGFSGGYLYIATGDGGSAGDPAERAQNKNSLLGKILRIDPTSTGYSTAGNPFNGSIAGADEVWSYGLRNPWRFSFYGTQLWIGDVGQYTYEEVNGRHDGKGQNYGWDVMEGAHCFEPATGCNTTGKRYPVAEYSHNGNGGGNCSVTGGYVIGTTYYFGDYCSGRIWSLPAGGTSTAESLRNDTTYIITSFGKDDDGQLYVIDYGDFSGTGGRIIRITGT